MLMLLLADTLRIAKPGASLLLFTGWRQLPATSDALRATGWLWRGGPVWHKVPARPSDTAKLDQRGTELVFRPIMAQILSTAAAGWRWALTRQRSFPARL